MCNCSILLRKGAVNINVSQEIKNKNINKSEQIESDNNN